MKQIGVRSTTTGVAALLSSRPHQSRCIKKMLGVPSRSDLVCLRVMQGDQECTTTDVEKLSEADNSRDGDSIATKMKTSSEVTQSSDAELESGISSYTGPILGVAALIGVIALTAILKDDISSFLETFVQQVEGMGPYGLFAFAGMYILLETLAVPATPLTLTAGYLFGQTEGTLVVSCASTVAAFLAFAISRYAARDKIAELAAGNKQFIAIDKAIKKDGFKFVFLLRLSPLLPFAASNYLYGLTSVEIRPYILASWLGMLPGTWAYVSAGSIGRDILSGGSSTFSPLQIAAGVGVTAGVLWLVGNMAKKALDEVDDEDTAQS